MWRKTYTNVPVALITNNERVHVFVTADYQKYDEPDASYDHPSLIFFFFFKPKHTIDFINKRVLLLLQCEKLEEIKHTDALEKLIIYCTFVK